MARDGSTPSLPGRESVASLFSRKALRTALLALVVGAAVLWLAADWLADLLWFTAMGRSAVFWRLFALHAAMFAGVGGVAWAFAAVNLHALSRRLDIAARLGLDTGASGARSLRIGLRLVAAATALGFGLAGWAEWDALLRFLWGVPAGSTDPLFGYDTGFYLFTVPLLDVLQTFALVLTGAASGGLLFAYLRSGRLRFRPPFTLTGDLTALRHLGLNLACLLAVLAAGFWLARFDLLISPDGAVFGAGWTDVHVRVPALWAMVAVSLGAAIVVVGSAWWGRGRLLLAAAVWAASAVAAVVVLPALFQSFVVAPNELQRERPYLQRNIAGTRTAFGLDAMQTRAYSPDRRLARADIESDRPTVDNIRIWDWRPLTRTFAQLQQIRSYYEFNDVDVDRYRIGGHRKQLMLAARELAPRLPGAQDSWVNRRLQYTHGFGLVATPASEKDANGQPILTVRDLPPKTPPELPIDRPEIYYGEERSGYRVVNTGIREFDYPRGDDNVYTRYGGDGGVLLDSWWKRLLLSVTTGDASVLLSGYIRDDSRIQFHRQIHARLSLVAPFLELDPDPYPVISGGRVIWLQDAYTTASRWPYSEPLSDGVNYIRNSVKATVDAYSGRLRLYVMDPHDPVIRTYRAALPSLFRDAREMPDAIRRHIRYPEALFRAQVKTFSTYHMTVPQVFYNREDVWSVPHEKYAGDTVDVEPYYVLMRLPGDKRLSFLLIQPLTPANRDNMIAWIAARCDPDDYGGLISFKLPKERLIFGPAQIEAKIDQDTDISRQLSLWDQRGSSVTRGNLLVIPIGHSFLYVEPVYLRADRNDLPQLKRIIVSDGDKLAMEPTLKEALAVVFGEAPPEESGAAAGGTTPTGGDLARARQALDAARKALANGDWEAFARHMTTLEKLLGRDDRP